MQFGFYTKLFYWDMDPDPDLFRILSGFL